MSRGAGVRRAFLLCYALELAACVNVTVPKHWEFELVSITSAGAPGEAPSGAEQEISRDGNSVAFTSESSQIDPACTNTRQVFVRDLTAHHSRCVSVINATGQGATGARQPAIDPTGRFVAFNSLGTLVTPSLGGDWNVYLRDWRSAAPSTIRVSNNEDGDEPNGPSGIFDMSMPSSGSSFGLTFSGDGSTIAFYTEATDIPGVQVTHAAGVILAKLTLTSPPSVASYSLVPVRTGAALEWYAFEPSISNDGGFVAYTMTAGGASPSLHIYKHDMLNDVAELVTHQSDSTSVYGDGASRRPSISDDGRVTVFMSFATNLDPAASRTPSGLSIYAHENGANHFVAVTGQSNPDGYTPVRAIVSGDGNYIAFDSSCVDPLAGGTGEDCTQMRQIFIYDRTHAQLRQVTHGAGDSFAPSISRNGSVISFTTLATDPGGGGTILATSQVYVGRLVD